jgi:hypothetical protein
MKDGPIQGRVLLFYVVALATSGLFFGIRWPVVVLHAAINLPTKGATS